MVGTVGSQNRKAASRLPSAVQGYIDFGTLK